MPARAGIQRNNHVPPRPSAPPRPRVHDASVGAQGRRWAGPSLLPQPRRQRDSINKVAPSISIKIILIPLSPEWSILPEACGPTEASCVQGLHPTCTGWRCWGRGGGGGSRAVGGAPMPSRSPGGPAASTAEREHTVLVRLTHRGLQLTCVHAGPRGDSHRLSGDGVRPPRKPAPPSDA